MKPVAPVPLPILSISHGTVALVGLQLGKRLGLAECPTERNKYGNIAYAAPASEDCYRQLVPEMIGKAAFGDGPLELDLLSTAKTYPAANWAAPVCVYVVSGNVEAVEVRLELNNIAWKTAAQIVRENTEMLGKQTAHRIFSTLPEVPPEFQAEEWKVTESTSQITQHSFIAHGGRRAGIVTVSRAIAYSEKAGAVAENAWRTPRTLCGASDVPVGYSGGH